MITIKKNANLSNWWDIRLFGELINNAKSEAKAMRLAQLEKEKLESEGNRVSIVTEEN
jgi:hypothetical protein